MTINEQGEIFGLFHDPYIVEKISENSKSFLEQLQSGTFLMNDYVQKKEPENKINCP